MARSVDDPSSRYVNGGQTETLNKRLGWWERRSIDRDENDIEIVLSGEFDRRPDLLAERAYGKQSYMWFILQYNNILDPSEEFVTGATIRLPNPSRVTLDIMIEPTGGV